MDKNDQYQHGQNIAEIVFHPVRDLEALACIRLFLEIVKAPAEFGHAEYRKDQRADREQKVADDEILAVEDITPADQVYGAPEIVSERTGNTCRQQDNKADHRRFHSAPPEVVHTGGDDVFKYRDNGRQAREGHEDEEQRTPQPTERHVDKYLRQGDEDQRGSRRRLYIIREAGGENDQTRYDRDKGIQRGDPQRLAAEGEVLAHITAEDLHRRDAQRQRKETLIHRGSDNVADPNVLRAFDARQQIEGDALPRFLERHTVDGEHHHQSEQAQHHDLADLFDSVLQTDTAYDNADDDGDRHISERLGGRLERTVEYAADPFRSDAVKYAGRKLHRVIEHPARYRRVEHHQHQTADDTHPTVEMPLTALRLERLVALHGAFAAASADGKLHRQYGRAHYDQKQQIKQNEQSAAVLTRYIRKLPDVSDPYRTAGADKQKAQP